MHHPKFLLIAVGITALTLGPVSTSLGDFGAAPAFAKGGNGGGNGGGGEGGGGKRESSSKSEKSSDRGNSGSSKSKAASAKSKKSDTKGSKSAQKSAGSKSKQKQAASGSKKKSTVVEASSRPKARDLGKMNGALNANINAVLAHIRNGNLNGPVGLLAGLAIADAEAAEAKTAFAELSALANAHDALTSELNRLEFADLETYLAAVSEEKVSAEDMALISGLIDAAGGLTADGTALATVRPLDTELADAETAASTGATSVTDAEAAILAAWNKDGDPDALLTALRDRLIGHEDEIAAAIAETADDATLTEETAPVVEETTDAGSTEEQSLVSASN